MDFEKLTRKSQEALQRAIEIARDQHHPEAAPTHLLAALLEQTDGIVLPLVQRLGVTPTSLRNANAEVMNGLSAAYGASGEVRLSQGLSKVLDAAAEEARGLNDDYVSTEHLLMAMAESSDRVAKVLADAGVTRTSILGALKEVRGAQRVDLAGPRVDLRGPGEVRTRPDRAGP